MRGRLPLANRSDVSAPTEKVRRSKSYRRAIKALMGVVALGTVLAGMEVHQRLQVGELAAKNGVALSGEVVNLASHLNEGRGMVDYTYMERMEMGEIPVYGGMERGDWVYGGKVGAINCVPSNKRLWPLRVFQSKQRVTLRGRVYSSYLEGPKGDRFFINGSVLFDEQGYLYFALTDVRKAMEKSCGMEERG